MQYFVNQFLTIIFCLSCSQLSAQQAPRLRNFQPSDYEAQNQNWSLAQSPEGCLYVGNNSAMLEFDGTRWRSFYLPEKQTVRAVATDDLGHIFCGGFAEFGFWAKNANGQMAYTSLSALLDNGSVGKEEIWHILVMPGYVLFQSFSSLYKYDYQKVTPIEPPNSIMFAQAVNGQVVVPVIERGLYALLPDNTFRILPGSEVLSDKIVQFLVPNGQGGLWAGTSEDGLYEWSEGVCTPWNHPLNTVFRQKQLNKAVALKTGGWAIGTILDGTYVLQANGDLRCQLHRENGLQNNTVLALLEDRDGHLWLGLDRGIDFAALRAPLMFFTDQTGKIGTVYAAAVHQNHLYVGTNQGVFRAPYPSVFDTPFSLVTGSQGQVWQLEVMAGQLILGHNSGTFVVEGASVRRISDITGGWCTIQVPARPDLLLQATYTGLILFQKKAGASWALVGRVTGFKEPLKKIAFDEAGNLWGTHPNKGLFRLRLSADWRQIEEFKAFSKADGLPTEFQLGLSKIPDSPLIVNAFPHAFMLKNANSITRFSPLNGRKWLPGRAGDVWVLDSVGLWLRHSSGVSQKISLTLVPGYEQVECLPNGAYLFCLENGFAVLDTPTVAALSTSIEAHPVYIRHLVSSEGQAHIPLDGITFDFSQNSLIFEFAQSFYEHPVRFSWFLTGFSKAWSPWSLSAEKEFTNLPAGRYTFRVRSELGGPEASLQFRILPPWYRSNGAFFGYFLGLIALFWVLEWYNRRRLAQHAQRMKMQQEREILVLEVENKSRELSNAAFNLIRKNEALQSLKDNLLDAQNEPRALSKIVREIDAHLEGDHDWEIFEESFNRVHDDFFKRLMLRFPDLTPGDLRLAAYLKMNLSTKEIAPLLNISIRGIENKRYRLRKKLDLNEEANLTEFIMSF